MKMERVIATGFAALTLCLGWARAADEPALATRKDQISYGVGVQTGRNLKNDAIDVNLDLLMRGIRDGMSGGKLLVSERELRQIMHDFQSELQRKIAGNRRIQGEENRKAGSAFLAQNAKKEGVVSLASGVQYKVVKAGSGKKPGPTDVVTINYRGTRLDGVEFDASEDGKPLTIQLGQLISGWQEALQLMPVGSRWEIVVPAERAYGERGVGTQIGPYQTLLFDVELVGIK
jgi:FKBP-type peptidyl-prolyl cis-trans isomerase FklB